MAKKVQQEEILYNEKGERVIFREPKKKRNPLLLGCLGLLLLFILLGACGAMFGLNDTEKKEEVSTEETISGQNTNKVTTEEVTTQQPAKEEQKNDATREQKAALGKAKTYSDMMHMSKQGIINQLTSEIEGFSQKDAQYAVDNLKANYKENALKKAEDYAKTQNMSNDAIYNQLTSSIEGFTAEEAQYAIDNLPK